MQMNFMDLNFMDVEVCDSEGLSSPTSDASSTMLAISQLVEAQQQGFEVLLHLPPPVSCLFC